MGRYLLYSTDGCHLCELAWDLIKQADMSDNVGIVDIINDEQLVTAYGESIPVLHNKTNNTALYWPFNLLQLTSFFSQEE